MWKWPPCGRALVASVRPSEASLSFVFLLINGVVGCGVGREGFL